MKRYWFALTLALLAVLSLSGVSAQKDDLTVEEQVLNGLSLVEEYPALTYWANLWNGFTEPQRDEARGFFAEGVTMDDGMGNRVSGPSAVLNQVINQRVNTDDLNLVIEEVIADKDTVVVSYTKYATRGGNSYDWGGIAKFTMNGDLISACKDFYEVCASPGTNCELLNRSQPYFWLGDH